MTDVHGVIKHPNSPRPTDYLFRVSLKCVIRNDAGEVLAVKEIGRDFWDLPGGGMDHGESIQAAITRELHEEIGLTGVFTYKLLAIEDPSLLQHNFYQLRIIVALLPENTAFLAGADADEVAFIDPESFKNSSRNVEQNIYTYSGLASNTVK